VAVTEDNQNDLEERASFSFIKYTTLRLPLYTKGIITLRME